MPTETAGRKNEGTKLRRALTLWDLALYGIILNQPIALMPVLGVVSQEARGHVVTAIAFLGVNVAAFNRYHLRGSRIVGNCLPPLAGAAISFYLWLSLRMPAKVVGCLWLAIGILYGAWSARGFRGRVISFEVTQVELEESPDSALRS